MVDILIICIAKDCNASIPDPKYSALPQKTLLPQQPAHYFMIPLSLKKKEPSPYHLKMDLIWPTMHGPLSYIIDYKRSPGLFTYMLRGADDSWSSVVDAM